MGKARFLIDKSELSKEIDALESSSSFTNQNELFEAVAKTPWAQAQKKSDGTTKPVTAAVVALRVKEFGITLKTPKGKRGFSKGQVPKKDAASKLAKMKKKKGYLLAVAALKYRFKKNPKLVKKMIEKGLSSAFIAAACEECVCGVISEAKLCTVYGCPLWLPSPYTGRKVDEPEEIIEEE